MKIHIGAPLLTLAIFFSFIELSSQYNKELLLGDGITVPDNLGIFYSISNNLDILVSDGHNQDIYGLMHKKYKILVCALEKDGIQYWVRKLMAKGQQVKVYAKKTYAWTDADTDLYDLKFDEVIQ
ncbi:uncharacterized protein LOC117173469 [Belonocnema kinseyi]|uniref:uncharacterized protein LOC117173469 n=1 Tax=Belonocnema kinseyi TaxID=2817044 RepID=UPI00143CE9CC|nr:uncharacterized protein LOC117173469 [Belonocnema kinseyi]XP_033217955.1 uncharacterized protein LOC117173469 [Belonocnema kinseyi]